ncbi:MAG: adenylate/guanylate cyclase domain-containing protein [Planctomycetes bacterium]|nr:adenylate/guanylate cyclase domain-containing protein [Planctomycetota bacterium]
MTANNKVLTIMFTDIKGFTEKTSVQSRDGLTLMLKRHHELVSPVIAKFGGTVIKTIGDAFMAVFESPTNAVLCAILIQHKMREYNLSIKDDEKIEIRIAVNAGEVQMQDNDVFGEAVNIAARIEGITDANEIFFTEAVYLAMNKSEVPSSEIGWRKLKGLAEAIKVYKVIQDEKSEKYISLISKWQSGKYGANGNIHSERPYFFAFNKKAVLVLIAIATAVTFAWYISTLSERRAFRDAEAFIAQGRPLDALQAIDVLKGKNVDYERVINIVGKAAEMQAKYLAENRRYDDIDAFLSKLSEQYAGAGRALYGLRIKYKLEQIEDAFNSNPVMAHRILEELYLKYPEDFAVLKATVDYNITKQFGSEFLALEALSKLHDKHVKQGDKTYSDFLKKLLSRITPSDGRAALVRKLVSEYYFGQKMKDDLRAMMAETRESERCNAYLILKAKNSISGAEEFAYHLMNVIYPVMDSSLVDAAKLYFNEAEGQGKLQELKKDIDYSRYGIFLNLRQNESEIIKEVRMILARYFMPEIRPLLEEWAYSEDGKARVNSYRTLEEAIGLENIDLFKYHSMNLMDINPQYFEPSVTEALEFFSGLLKDAGEERQKALDMLKAARGKLADDIAEMRVGGTPAGFYSQGEEIIAAMSKLLKEE